MVKYVNTIIVSFDENIKIEYLVYEVRCCNTCHLFKELKLFKSRLKNIEYNKTCRNCLDKSRKITLYM